MNFEGTALIRYFGWDTQVNIGLDVERICVGSFSKCKQLRKLEFESPSNVRSIESRAFERCWLLESILIPASVEIVGERSFWKCRSLREVRIAQGSNLRRIERESLKAINFRPLGIFAMGKDSLDPSPGIY
jgi:hypothetical protein